MTPAARLQAAIEILDGLAASSIPADRFIREFFRARRYAGSKDRAAVSERVFQICRHRASFAWRMNGDAPRALVIASLLSEGMNADAVTSLFSGEGYAPDALSEAERAAIACTPSGEPPLHVRGDFPAFLEPELAERFGENLLAEMQAMTSRAPIDLRVNALKATREDVLALLRAEGYDARPTRYAPFAIRVPAGASGLDSTVAFQSGLFEFQDEAAQIAVVLCDAKPGMRVLDIAAGAGGKSLALAAEMKNEGEIAASDISSSRLMQIDARAKRAGVTIIGKISLSPNGGEGRVRGMQTFDLVLLDAPCSGSGTWRRQPEQKWRLTPARLAKLVTIQDELLASAAAHVAPGGRLVYATCSFLPCENERRIAAFLENMPDFSPVPAAAIWRNGTDTAQPPGMSEFFHASPYVTGTDGFFTAVLAKEAL